MRKEFLGDPPLTVHVGSIFRVVGAEDQDTVRLNRMAGPWGALVFHVIYEPKNRSIRRTTLHPSGEELAECIRDNLKIPGELREAIARRFSHPRRGRPKKGESPRELADALLSCPDQETEKPSREDVLVSLLSGSGTGD